jgi:hypothetical protein
MRLSETITIYLAAGAPFGVAVFLREQTGCGHALALVKATGATLLWPFAASAILLARLRHTGKRADAEERRIDASVGEKVVEAQRDLLASVYRVYELAQEDVFGKGREKMERAACRVRESVEKYVGLAMAAAEIEMGVTPDEREMELCRIAGRTGDDLLLAGLCIHRRNVARIRAHLERARAELVHTLAEVREVAAVDVNRLDSCAGEQADLRARSKAILKSYGHAIELFSLLDDPLAARSVARLLDAECARLRRLGAPMETGASERTCREEQCTAHTHPMVSTGFSQSSGLIQG